jgi:hypothetical protein
MECHSASTINRGKNNFLTAITQVDIDGKMS